MNRDRAEQNFILYFKNKRYRVQTIRSYINELHRFIDWTEGRNIHWEQCTYNELLDYIRYNQEQQHSKQYINQKLTGLKHLFHGLIEIGKRKDNPAEELRIRNVIKRVPHDLLEMTELEKLYKSYQAIGVTGKRNKAMLSLLIYQGLNTGELAKLEVKDVNLEAGAIYIPQVGRSNPRTLKLESHQVLQLQKYILKVRPVIMKITEKESDKLFISTGKSQQLQNSFARMMVPLKKLSDKIKDRKQIRASIITHWLKKHNIRQVQYMIGHRYVSSTEHYKITELEDLQSQLEKMHPLK